MGTPDWPWLDVEHGVENDVSEYTDQRWRKICLHPHGYRWETAMQHVLEDVSAATLSPGTGANPDIEIHEERVRS